MRLAAGQAQLGSTAVPRLPVDSHGEAPLARSAMIVSRVFEPEASAAAFRLGALARALESQGCRLTVITSRAPGARRSTATVRRWPVLRDSSGVVRGYLPYLSFDIPAFFRVLLARRTDVIIVEPPPTTGTIVRIAATLRRIPYVYYAADVLSAAVQGAGMSRGVVRAVRWLESFSLRGAHRVITVSTEVRERLIELGTAPERIVVVGTGIDTDLFTPQGERAPAPWPYFVYAGTASEVHGAGVFVEAFALVAARHPDVRLLLFSSGTDTELMRDAAAPVAERVEFRGIVDATSLTTWLRGATASLASVRPERGYDFAFATKALASIACGTPVVYAGVGAMADLVRDNELGLAVAWEVSAVADAMLAMLADDRSPEPERLARWAEENFSLDSVGARAAEVLLA